MTASMTLQVLSILQELQEKSPNDDSIFWPRLTPVHWYLMTLTSRHRRAFVGDGVTGVACSHALTFLSTSTPIILEERTANFSFQLSIRLYK